MNINKDAGQILNVPDLYIIDDYINDDDLNDHRDEILERMRMAVDEINAAAAHILTELYFEAAAPFTGTQFPKSFTLRTSDYHDILSDALNSLRRNGFFVDSE